MIYQAARQMNLFEIGLDAAGICGGEPERAAEEAEESREDFRDRYAIDEETGIELNEPGRCTLCGEIIDEPFGLHKHHIFFGTSNRELSEEDGMTVYLCPKCHEHGPEAVHRNRETDLWLKQAGERVWLRQRPGKTVEDFIRRYGKNYL